jgi:NAD(P)-dependent dehydrogenase (short-subunit alcohol dehydrogenase family)
VAIHTQPAATGPDSGQDPPWTCHATGTATPAPADDHRDDWDWAADAWPPPGSQPVSLDGLYSELTAAGLDYGPTFQGLTAAWRHNNHLYTEAVLPDGTDPDGYQVHPALLDANLHAALTVGLTVGSDAPVRLPVSYTDLTLCSRAARNLRARLVFTTDDCATVDLADPSGQPVGSIRSLALRPADLRRLAPKAPGQSNLFTPSWVPVPPGPAPLPSSCAVIGSSPAASLLAASLEVAGIPVAAYAGLAALTSALDDGTPPPALLLAGPDAPREADPPEAALIAVTAALTLLQGYLASPGLASVPLAWVTAGAVGPGPVTDLAAAATAGLIGSAQTEHPARIAHLDLDPETAQSGVAARALAATLATAEPHTAIRGTVLHAARLTRTAPHPSPPTADLPGRPLDPDGTVLITGGTGTLGAIIARHLATTGQARHFLLLSRRGPDALGADELAADLTVAGAEVVITACDVTSRPALARALAAISPDHPLTAVIHTAGTTSDATITTMTEDQVSPVLAPKTDAAWHLHQLTADLPLAAFVLFSSATGQLGAPGQGNYAAANTFLDALATWRQAHGLPATSLAWGLWAEDSAFTATLTQQDRARLTRNGVTPMPTVDTLVAFDAALRLEQPVLTPVTFNWVALHEQARAGILAPVLRGLIRTQVTHLSAHDRSLAARLTSLDESGRAGLITSMVRDLTVMVLGQEKPEQVDLEKAFSDLGFNSLTAVEFRNRLIYQTQLSLPASIIYDYPTPNALAQHLLKSLMPEPPSPERSLLTHLDVVEKMLPELSGEKGNKTEIIGRLKSILHRLNQPDHAYEENEDIGTDLHEATDQELFDTLDSELEIF